MNSPAIHAPPIRPISVTVVCWILIVTSILLTIHAFEMLRHIQELLRFVKDPFHVKIQTALSFVSLAITFFCAVFMLKRSNWARVLYVCWNLILTAALYLPPPFRVMLPPGPATFFVVVGFLFMPPASQFFTPTRFPIHADLD